MEAASVSRADKSALLGFLRSLYTVLRALVADRRQLLQPEVRRLLAGALRELEQENRFEEIEQMLEKGEYDASLRDHGLKGDQLELKTATFERALEVVEKDEERRFVSKRHRRSLRAWLLQTADVGLDSAAAVLPPLAALKELKAAGEAAYAERTGIRDWVGKRWGVLKGRFRPPPEEEREVTSS